MSLKKCVYLIDNKDIREGVMKILHIYKPILEKLPASVTGKHHKNETAEEHILNVCFFLKILVKEFNIFGLDKDILFASGILHDIGNCAIVQEGKVHGWNYYEKTGWSRKSKKDALIHPTIGCCIIGKNAFKYCSDIQALVITHMSHWYDNNCLSPNMLNDELKELSKILCIADYLASLQEIKIDLTDLM